MNKKFS